MSDNRAGQVLSPPDLPLYLKSIYNLQPIFGVPSDEEVIGIHAVVRMAQKAIEIPGTGDAALLARLADHLFDVQMARYRNEYMSAAFPEDMTYTPPSLPPHVTVQLESVTGAPSEEDIIKVQAAIRLYNQFANIPSMFDPRVDMELAQHLFDIQMGKSKYTQRARQVPTIPPVQRTTTSTSTRIFATERTSDTSEGDPATNNPGTAGHNTINSMQPISAIEVLGCIERSNQLAERANQLSERSNLLIERSNELTDRANQLVDRSNKPVEPPNNHFERFIELFGRLNERLEQSDRFNELSTKPLEKLGDMLKSIHQVLARIQHAIVRNYEESAIITVSCPISEKGYPTEQSTGIEAKYITWEQLPEEYKEVITIPFLVVTDGGSDTMAINDALLGRFLRFYGVGEVYFEGQRGTMLKSGCLYQARLALSRYSSSQLG